MIFTRIIAVSNIFGSRIKAAILKSMCCENKSLVLLLGNTCSPVIIRQIHGLCEGLLYGVTGGLDDVSVVSALKSLGAYICGKIVYVDNISIAGLGLQIGSDLEKLLSISGRTDVLVTYLPPRSLCREIHGHICGLETVDKAISKLNPRVLFWGWYGPVACYRRNDYYKCIKGDIIEAEYSAKKGVHGFRIKKWILDTGLNE